ncbi:hypothetical protein OKW21_000163 [Catalinimonas alkaloidigena]|uniref:hypothetical protein n=1 Tax=Catalinimonas alkaloidigena TaxID=1075417 RepID=UPI002406BCB0|nr:hypothetical protein [Catalinimonas alkaloidigena]MDF9794900.1 hypothetical protein [Catalinimonas alkaloidigena]
MELDHLMIFSSQHGAEADKLLQYAFVEGSSNTHPGQGTANRRFFFENAFFEWAFVVNEAELSSEIVQPTFLWERSQWQTSPYSPFGMCIRFVKEETVFDNALRYAPPYMPEGAHIDILTMKNYSELPMIFRTPFEKNGYTQINEPYLHPNGVKQITKVIFGVSDVEQAKLHLKSINNQDWFGLTESQTPKMEVVFDDHKQRQRISFEPDLPLVFSY